MRKNLFLLFTVLFLSAGLFAQNRSIGGKVSDAKSGTALQGVTVSVKGNRMQPKPAINGH
jgi:hypothetical protein